MKKILITLLILPLILMGQNKITCLYDTITNSFKIPSNLEIVSLSAPTLTSEDRISTLSSYDIIEMDMVLLDLINDYRTENNLKPITFSNRVWGVGEHHTRYMVKSGDLSHNESLDLPNFKELSFNQRSNKICDTVGKGSFSLRVNENVAKVFDDGDLEYVAEKILRLWIASPEHNKALLMKTYTSSSLFGSVCSMSTKHQRNKKRGVEYTKNVYIYTTLSIVEVLD